MRRVIITAVCTTLGAIVAAACNSVGDCPTLPIMPGGLCSSENLQCAYTLPAPDDAGTPTSCICTAGAWACPSASSGDDASGDDAMADWATADEASGDGSAEASAEAQGAEAGNQDAGTDASAQSGADAGGG